MARTAIVVCVLALLAYVVFYYMNLLGFMSHYYKHHPGTCRKVIAAKDDMYGFEDFQVTTDGLAFITSGFSFGLNGSDDFHHFIARQGVKGRIFTFDFRQPEAAAVELKIQVSKASDLTNFHPHGISLLEDKIKGEHLLYVVNHPDGQLDRVEKFRYLPSAKLLRHEKSFLSQSFYTLNDIAVIKEDEFYVTNYMYYKKLIPKLLEIFLPLSLCNIVYFDGKEYHSAVEGLNGPNGATLSADNKFLYVNFPHEKRTRVYLSDPKNRSLTLVQTLDLSTMSDNFHLSQSGDALYTAGHPLAHVYLDYIKDPGTKVAPSQVLRFPLNKDGTIQEDEITELFYDYGELISASSIATVYNDLLLIGSVINNLVLCDTSGPPEAR